MSRQSRHRFSERSDGFTVVECLVGLAISAILLTAMAVAFSASAMNFRENERMYQTLNNARQALTRMTGEIRTGSSVEPTDPAYRCSFLNAASQDITYEFRSVDNRLYLITNSNGNEYVLCDDVTAASFTKTPTDDGFDCKSVQMSLTVRIGDYERTLSGAAVVRRNVSL